MGKIDGLSWTYSTTLEGGTIWHAIPVTFDTAEEAADAAKRWMIMAAEHGHIIAVRLERIKALKAG